MQIENYMCDKCSCLMNEDDTTTLEIRGVQNFDVHLCVDCLSKFNFFIGE